MKTRLLLLSFLGGIIVVACTKREQMETTNNSTIVGVWKTDSTIYEGYKNNVLVTRDVDKDDSEESTVHFLEDGTVKGYYVVIDDFGMRDTAELSTGTYTFNAVTKDLVVKDETGEGTVIVRTLTQQKMVMESTYFDSPDPEIDKEVYLNYLSRVQ